MRVSEIEKEYRISKEMFSSYLKYDYYKDGLFWAEDRVFFMLEIIAGIDFYALPDDVKNFYLNLRSFLNMFPNELNTTVQSFFMPFRDIEFMPDAPKTSNPASLELYNKICEKILRAPKEGYFDESSKLREVRNFLVVTFERPKKDWKKAVESMIDKSSQLVGLTEEEIYQQVKHNALVSLDRQGVLAEEVDADRFIYLMFTLLNQDLDPLKIKYTPDLALRDQICYNLVTIDHHEVKYSKGSWLMLSVLNMNRMSFGFLSELLSLQRPFFLSAYVHKVNQAVMELKLHSDKNLMSRFNPTVAAGIEETLKRMEAGDILYELEVTLGVFAKSPREIETVKAELADFISEYGWDMHYERSIGQNLFLAALPAHYNQYLERRIKVFEEHAVCLMNFRTMRTFFHDTGVPLVSVDLSPKKIDIFKTQAYGTMVSGGSGSGKTFLSQYLVTVKHALGEKVFIIDPLGNYEELCTILGGEYRRIGLSEDTDSLNIFPNLQISEEEKARGEFSLKSEEQKGMMAMLAFLIGKMAYLSEDKRLSSEELSVVNEALNEMYIKIPTKEIGLSAFVSTLENFGEERDQKGEPTRRAKIAYRLAKALDVFQGNQMYSGLISDEPEEFSNSLTVFDVSAVKEDQNLLELSIAAIMAKLSEEVLKDPGRSKSVFIDEAHYLIRSERVVEYISRGVRVWRTFNAALVLITQQLSDLLDNEAVGEGIFKTINNFFILRQSQQSFDLAQKYLGYNDTEKEYLGSLMTLPGKYSKLAFYSQDFGDGDKTFGIFYLSLPPETICAFTTRPTEKALRKRLIEEYSKKYRKEEAVREALREMTRRLFGS